MQIIKLISKSKDGKRAEVIGPNFETKHVRIIDRLHVSYCDEPAVFSDGRQILPPTIKIATLRKAL